MSDYVSRAGLKLEHALRAFAVDVTGLVCADFGCNVGGFTDCLLRHGAERVIAVDTGYGTLDWRLRNDPRVLVLERTNALHAPPPEPVDLVCIDLGWTPQRHAVPAALRWLAPGGRLISLLKPHYELTSTAGGRRAGQLDPAEAAAIAERVAGEIEALGTTVEGPVESPIRGGKSGRKGAGNVEYLVLITPQET